ncbi:hypothetical protein Pmani_030457 [Petrolisthes manimaculis]|uniref:Protein BANP n=1 Tax=Petrolisthes manimaculis TaxID=1843537 RepID=A0AAE1TTK1_9EUCA|nr:hypothetical protein Pmani_030457 [Petrolisthes manimaculis]
MEGRLGVWEEKLSGRIGKRDKERGKVNMEERLGGRTDGRDKESVVSSRDTWWMEPRQPCVPLGIEPLAVLHLICGLILGRPLTPVPCPPTSSVRAARGDSRNGDFLLPGRTPGDSLPEPQAGLPAARPPPPSTDTLPLPSEPDPHYPTRIHLGRGFQNILDCSTNSKPHQSCQIRAKKRYKYGLHPPTTVLCHSSLAIFVLVGLGTWRDFEPHTNRLERKLSVAMGEESEEDCDYSTVLPRVKQVPLSLHDLLNHLVTEVSEIRTCMNTRLTSLETKVSVLVQTCNRISSKLDTLERQAGKQSDQNVPMEMAIEMPNAPIIVQDTDTNHQMNIINLNSEEEFPHGSWLGDPTHPTLRVRCPITPQNLLHINSTCMTAEKMALTLLDYLFTKDELATSNLSGRSRWNKRQLDPLMIFGIRCHLLYKFNITTKLWHKIRQNMDSKCRSAWKRRIRGMVTQPRNSRAPQIGHTSSVRKDPAVNEDISFDFDSLQNSNLDLSDVKVITQSPTCELRILNATSEQISQLQDTQEIILSEEQILAQPSAEKSILISNSSSVTMSAEVLSGEELEPLTSQSSSLATMDHTDHRITLKAEPELAILDQHGILATRDSETDD